MSKQGIRWNKEHLKIIQEKRSNMMWSNRKSLERKVIKWFYDKSIRKLNNILFLAEMIYLII